jgi:hypothetical protein
MHVCSSSARLCFLTRRSAGKFTSGIYSCSHPAIVSCPLSTKAHHQQKLLARRVRVCVYCSDRRERAVHISRLQGRLSDELDIGWLHLRGRRLQLDAGGQGQFTVYLFEEVLRLPPVTAAAAVATVGADVTRS